MRKNNDSKILQEIISIEQNINRNLSLELFNDFHLTNMNNKLLENSISFQKVRNPDITVVMLVYNQARFLHKCLRSIQNQSIKTIEIIIVDDCSLDNSTEIIKEYRKDDPRIIIIEHDANEGRIKSRSDGIRKAKGKYITVIDGDDSFIHKDILKNSFYIAQKANLDVTEFQGFTYRFGKLERIIKNYPYLNLQRILYQPELKTKFIFMNNNYPSDFVNRAIWGKLIKKKLFKQILEYIGYEYTNDFINVAEDTIMVISLFHLAKSYYLMKEVGYLYTFEQKEKKIYKLENKVCRTINNKIKGFDFVKFLKFLVWKTGNDEKEQNMAYTEILSVNYDYLLNKISLHKKIYQIIINILNTALQFQFLNVSKKENLIKLKQKVIQKSVQDNIFL